MGDYKRYVNPKEPGQTCFVTATCLDFAHLFMREEMRTSMCISLIDDCIRHRAVLKGFVVMSNHIHLYVRPREDETISRLMQVVKENSATHLMPKLAESELYQLRLQTGLGGRKFWRRSFRANPIYSESVALQKLNYLHQNPVRAGLCSTSEDYQWSSAFLRNRGLVADEGIIDLGLARAYYDSLKS